MNDRVPYTYKITFTQLNHQYNGFKYIGAKWAKGCNPETFWIKYFTCSRIIHELIEDFGKNSFTYKIIKSDYGSIEECVAHESNLLKEIDAQHNPIYFNACNGDGKFLNKFVTKKTKENKKNKFLTKYGKNSYVETDEFKEKSKQKNIKVRGVENSMQCQEVKDAGKETCRRNYNCDYPMQSPIVQERFNNTSQERYQCDWPAQNPEVYKKNITTNLKIYGTKYVVNVDSVKEKSKQVCLTKYKATSPMGYEGTKEKCRETRRNRAQDFICENDGMSWKIVADAAKFYNLNPISISRCIQGKQKITKGHKFHYLSEYIPHIKIKKSFVCENDYKIWNNQVQASKFYNLRQTSISKVLLGRIGSTKGYKFRYLKDTE
jgi:hypothetical protein